MVPLDDERRKIIPTFESLAKLKDLFWMLEGCFFPKETPMWVGWNSANATDMEHCQKKRYITYGQSTFLLLQLLW